MGTSKTNYRRRRPARARGLASCVAFMLLFALALGQGSSLVAIANDGIDASEFSASNTAEADGSVEEGEEAAAEEEAAPDEQDPAGGADSSDGSSGSGGGRTPKASATSGSEDGGGGAWSPRNAGSSTETTRHQRLAAPTPTELEGGDISLDYVAAGPFTYDHATGFGDYPTFGYNDRHIDKDDGVVESLESGDFECGDYVTFFTEITVDAGAAAEGTIELDYTFGAETTGQPGLGFSDIIDVGVNTPDDGNINEDGDEVATLIAEGFDSSGYDQVTGTVEVVGLDPGDVIIVYLIAELTCEQGETPTGNILNAIESGRVTSNDDDRIPVGQQTVPMKTTGFVPEPAIDIEKSCPSAALVGEDITYTITLTNNGNEDLNIDSVLDTVNGNDPVDITDLFPAVLEAESDPVVVQWTYEADGTEPDPLPNSVTVDASGVFSSADVTDTSQCDTDILNPEILIEKTCPATALVGDDITYSFTLTNLGDEDLENIEVWDTVNGNDPVDLSDLFPDTLAEGADPVEVEWTYEADGTEPDPLPNSVTVTATGVTSEAEVDSTDGCQTTLLTPLIQIVKDGPAEVHRGDTITYEFEVTNIGETELFDVELSDPICDPGTIVPGEDVDASLAVDEVWHFTCTHFVTEEDPDPIPNLATVRGDTQEGEGGDEVTDDDDHLVEILHPDIEIVKVVSEEIVPVGTTVTYTYVVTNTGDTTLFDVVVTDDVLGLIGVIEVLEPGAENAVTLTKDAVVGEDVVINVGTARGHDILDRFVEASDDAIVTPIAGENPPPPTPFTGSDAGRLGLISIALLGIGVTVVAATRRRRQTEAEAA
ncbi:MAG TPA: hypothetical protein VF108_02145 [Actinomycetota bacterium]